MSPHHLPGAPFADTKKCRIAQLGDVERIKKYIKLFILQDGLIFTGREKFKFEEVNLFNFSNNVDFDFEFYFVFDFGFDFAFNLHSGGCGFESL